MIITCRIGENNQIYYTYDKAYYKKVVDDLNRFFDTDRFILDNDIVKFKNKLVGHMKNDLGISIYRNYNGEFYPYEYSKVDYEVKHGMTSFKTKVSHACHEDGSPVYTMQPIYNSAKHYTETCLNIRKD